MKFYYNDEISRKKRDFRYTARVYSNAAYNKLAYWSTAIQLQFFNWFFLFKLFTNDFRHDYFDTSKNKDPDSGHQFVY